MRHQVQAATKPIASASGNRPEDTTPVVLRRLPASTSAAGDAITYGVAVHNVGPDLPLWVRLEHELPLGTEYLASEPPAEVEGRRVIWDLGRIDPNQESLVMLVLQTGTAGAAFDTTATRFRAICKKPAPASLSVALLPIATAAQGETAKVVIEVTNTGGRPATDVRVSATLPPAVRRASGQELTLTHPAIPPLGKIRLVARAIAVEEGDHPFRVLVSTAEGLREQAESILHVTAPRVTLRLTGPARCELGRHAEYRAEVANDGTGTAANVQVNCTWPEELCFVSASAAGDAEAGRREFRWLPGDLAPGAVSDITLTLAPRLPGEVRCRAVAVVENGGDCEAEMTTNIAFSGDESGAVSPTNLLGDLLQKLDHAAVGDGPSDNATVAPSRVERGRGEGQEHVVFTLAGTDYALPISNVLEIGRPLSITPVPNVADWILGVANVRGDIVSMIDLRQFLGLSRGDQGPNGRLIVVRGTAEEVVVGLRVDQVKGICGVKPEAVLPPTSLTESGVTPYLRGVTERNDRLLAVLDLDRLLAPQEERAFPGT